MASTAWKGMHARIGGWMLANPLRRWRLQPYIKQVLAAVGEDQTILDVGAGNGLVAVEVARKLVRGRLLALDLSETMLARLVARAEGQGVAEKVQTIKADAASTGLEDESVDVVTCNYLLHELEDPEAAIREMHRVLRPGGRFFIRDFRKSGTFGIMTLFGRFHHDRAHGPLDEEELGRALRDMSTVRIERRGGAFVASGVK